MTHPRYSRQTLFHGIGESGQEKIQQARVAVIGCGALGTVNAEMLARAGVGHLRLVDRDFVEESNLQRQSLFTERHARERFPKAVAAKEAIGSINRDVQVSEFVEDLTHSNIPEICSRLDVIVDGTDNFETRFLLNDFAVRESVPWIYAGCVGSYGVACVIRPGTTPCLRCLLGDVVLTGAVQTCETAGILAPVVHAVASFQVTQALKLLVGSPVAGKLLRVDLWDDSWTVSSVEAARDHSCRCCVQKDLRFLSGEISDRMIKLCGRNAVQIVPSQPSPVDFQDLAKRLQGAGRTRSNPYLMLLEVEDHEITLFPDGRAIVKGTDDPAVARSLYARYVGK